MPERGLIWLFDTQNQPLWKRGLVAGFSAGVGVAAVVYRVLDTRLAAAVALRAWTRRLGAVIPRRLWRTHAGAWKAGGRRAWRDAGDRVVKWRLRTRKGVTRSLREGSRSLSRAARVVAKPAAARFRGARRAVARRLLRRGQ